MTALSAGLAPRPSRLSSNLSKGGELGRLGEGRRNLSSRGEEPANRAAAPLYYVAAASALEDVLAF
jgi:hypothetical protein